MKGSGGMIFRMGMGRRVLVNSHIIRALSAMGLKRGKVFIKRQRNMSTKATSPTINSMDRDKLYTQMETSM